MKEWLDGLFSIHCSIQAVVVLSAVIASGLALGNIKVKGVSLGVAFVFFAGITAGYAGLNVDATVLDYAQTFGLALFVYTLGLHVGPNFFGSLKHEGMALNLWSLALIANGLAAHTAYGHQPARHGGTAVRCHNQHTCTGSSHTDALPPGDAKRKRSPGYRRNLSSWSAGSNLRHDAPTQILRKTRRPEGKIAHRR